MIVSQGLAVRCLLPAFSSKCFVTEPNIMSHSKEDLKKLLAEANKKIQQLLNKKETTEETLANLLDVIEQETSKRKALLSELDEIKHQLDAKDSEHQEALEKLEAMSKSLRDSLNRFNTIQNQVVETISFLKTETFSSELIKEQLIDISRTADVKIFDPSSFHNFSTLVKG